MYHSHQTSSHYGGPSILYPQDWTRYDPSLNSYSPLAQFSSQTLREHSDTIDKLTNQLETITRRLHELSIQDTEDHRRYTRMLDVLQREESDIVALLSLNRSKIDELERTSTAEVVRRRDESQTSAAHIRDLQEDLAAEVRLEGEMLSVKRNIEEKLTGTMERRAVFANEFRQGMTILESDHKDAKAISMQADYVLQGRSTNAAGIPRPVAVTNRSAVVQSPHRPGTSGGPPLNRSAGLSPRPPARPVSPPRGAAVSAPLRSSPPRQTLASAVYGRPISPSRPGRLSPPKSPRVVEQLNSRAGRTDEPPIAFEELVRAVGTPSDPFRALSQEAEQLHAACRAGRYDDIRDLLRRHQSIVAEQHPATGDTALHVLCGAPIISLDAIVEVCTVESALLKIFNKHGLLPFHVACLNPMDNDHKLKMFFVTNLNTNPSVPAALGENIVHLCAKSDYLNGALRFAVERLHVDPSVRVLVTNRQGASVQMNALDIAKESREAHYNADFLTTFFSTHGLQ